MVKISCILIGKTTHFRESSEASIYLKVILFKKKQSQYKCMQMIQ